MSPDSRPAATLAILLADLSNQINFLITYMRQNRMQGLVYDQLGQFALHLERFKTILAENEDELRSLHALADIGQVVNSSLELENVLRIVMDTIVSLTGAERGFLMLKDEKNELVTRMARNWEQESILPSDFAISRTVVNQVVNQGAPVLTTNAQLDPRFGSQQSIVALNLRAILCVPLMVKTTLIGVIYADNRIRSGIFTQNELNLLSALANQAAVAIENARLFASVRAALAEVTGLKNLMDNIFSSIASGVITTASDDKVLLCNRAAEMILGRSAPDLVGLKLAQALPSLASLLPAVLQVLKSDQPVVGLEISQNLPERGLVDLRFNLSPLKDARQSTQGVAIVVDDLTEKKQLEAKRRLFERMVSPAVIEQLDPDALKLGGTRTDLTVLFADIRGFTAFSEDLAPELLMAVLNNHLAAAAEAILAQEGTIDKFLGDAVMAWFNAPIPQPDHTLRAVRAALAIRQSVHVLHRRIPAAQRLSFGVGIQFGEAVLGLVGTEKRLEYTAIGDSVNTARRIQEGSAPGQILIGLEAYERVKDLVVARQVDPLTVKGKREPVRVYEVVDLR